MRITIIQSIEIVAISNFGKLQVTHVAFACDFSSKNLFNLSAEMAKQMGIYRPRSPQKGPFYQCIADHFEEFAQAYDERFEREYGFCRPVICEVIPKYLECGDLTHGFARIRCDHCGRERPGIFL